MRDLQAFHDINDLLDLHEFLDVEIALNQRTHQQTQLQRQQQRQQRHRR